jgi:hypothetical protein
LLEVLLRLRPLRSFNAHKPDDSAGPQKKTGSLWQCYFVLYQTPTGIVEAREYLEKAGGKLDVFPKAKFRNAEKNLPNIEKSIYKPHLCRRKVKVHWNFKEQGV